MNLDVRVNTALATTLVLWASAFVAIRVALPGLGVAGLSVGRLLVASLGLAVAAPFLGVRPPARADLARIAGCGITGMTAYQLLLNAGERTVSAGTASLLVNTGPIFAALLASWLLSEPLTPRRWAGIGVGCTGAAVMTLAQGGTLRPSPAAMLVLAAALSQALFFVLQKPLLARYGGFEVTCHAMWAGTLLSMPLLPALLHALPRAGSGPLVALAFLGAGPSAVGFVAWAYAGTRLAVSTAASSLYLVPFLAIAIGWLGLSETVHPAALAGGLLALTGVAISRSAPRRPVPLATPAAAGTSR